MAHVQPTIFGTIDGAEPFLQWMGGKRRLWVQMRPYFPKQFATYHEPFLGGGYVFLALQPQTAHLGDASVPLVTAWQMVKERPVEVLEHLRQLPDTRAAYIAARSELNLGPADDIRKAALFIYLTHTCFNGMLRFNRRGECNSPYGTGDGWQVPEQAIWAAHASLKQTEVRREDFAAVLDRAQPGDLVYLDPPYDESDTPYIPGGWTKADTTRLATVGRELSDRGCHVRVSNHNTALIREVFKDFEFIPVERPGSFNGRPDRRQPVEEVLIANL